MPVVDVESRSPSAPSPARVREAVPSATSTAEIDDALGQLRAHARQWVELPMADRRAILEELTRDFAEVAPRWVELCRRAEGIPDGSPQTAEEWVAGPYMVIRNLELLARSLEQIDRHGKPQVPGPIGQRPDGRVTARVFPQNLWDKIFYSGVTAEVWMQPGVTRQTLADTMAVAYAEPPAPSVGLVLGAGNVSSIGPMDVLYGLFVEKRVVAIKMHPVNAYLGPLLEEGFRALVDWGFLRVVYGDVEVGQYLCEHPEIDSIHITGSDQTVDAIVFGPGEEGRRRKAERRPKNPRPISSELGNVSPVIVVPGPWSEGDLDYQAQNVASMLTNNAGFNCNAARVLVQHAQWPHRRTFRDRLETAFGAIPTRYAYYPGAADRWRRFVEAHPEGRQIGIPGDPGELPWVLIPDVPPAAEEEICFEQEAFCGVMAETALDAPTPADFLDRAVDFCNQTLWGTLNVTLLVHPKSLADAEIAAAFERALDRLVYGTVAINCWAAVGYGLVVTPWGAPPGHDLYDIQSGTGVVHNTLMFDRVEKTIVRTPFRMAPKPLWFANHRTALEMARRVTEFEVEPSVTKLPGIFWQALRG